MTSAAMVLPVPLSPANSALMPSPRFILLAQTPTRRRPCCAAGPARRSGATIPSVPPAGQSRRSSPSARCEQRAHRASAARVRAQASHMRSSGNAPSRPRSTPAAIAAMSAMLRLNWPASAAGPSVSADPEARCQAARCSSSVGLTTSTETESRTRRVHNSRTASNTSPLDLARKRQTAAACGSDATRSPAHRGRARAAATGSRVAIVGRAAPDRPFGPAARRPSGGTAAAASARRHRARSSACPGVATQQLNHREPRDLRRRHGAMTCWQSSCCEGGSSAATHRPPSPRPRARACRRGS